MGSRTLDTDRHELEWLDDWLTGAGWAGCTVVLVFFVLVFFVLVLGVAATVGGVIATVTGTTTAAPPGRHTAWSGYSGVDGPAAFTAYRSATAMDAREAMRVHESPAITVYTLVQTAGDVVDGGIESGDDVVTITGAAAAAADGGTTRLSAANDATDSAASPPLDVPAALAVREWPLADTA